MMFIVDSNVLINAARQYYHPDIAPTFWEWLVLEHEKGNIASVEAVRREIDDGDKKKGAGFLQTWAAQLPDTFWLKSGPATVPAMAELSAWVMHPDRPYTQAARHEFLRIADYELVAHAKCGMHCVATFELPSPESKKRVLIPDACNGVSVPYTEPFAIYRDLGLRFG